MCHRLALANLLILLVVLPNQAAEMSSLKTTCTYKTVDGCSIQADVYRPSDKVVRPVILWIHGGALIFGSLDHIETRHLERYLDAGFAVVSIDYRLAPETKLVDILQ